MNLERQTRRHLFGRPQRCRVAPAPGCGPALEEELRGLLASLQTPTDRSPVLKRLRDAIALRSVDYRVLLELTLRLTTARDLSLTIAGGPVHNRKDLAELLRRARWELFLAEGSVVALHVDSRSSTLYHEGLVRDSVTREIEKYGAQTAPAGEEDDSLRVRLRIVRNLCTVELSLAGAPLWRRGYRGLLRATAPLREDLAQSALRLSLAASPRPLVPALLVPFAGSGTLLFEYLINRFAIPPFLFGRSYAFERFACGVPASVRWVRRRLTESFFAWGADTAALVARLIDRSDDAATSTSSNLLEFSRRLAAVAGGSLPPALLHLDMDFLRQDVFARPWRELLPEGVSEVFLPLNPPYGRRHATRSTDELFRRIGEASGRLADSLAAGALSGFVLCPSETSWRAFRAGGAVLSTTTSHFTHGGIDIRLCRFHS